METAINIIIAMLMNALAFCAVPVILRFTLFRSKRPADKTVLIILIINHAVVWLIFRVLEMAMYGETDLHAIGILYFLVNCAIYGVKNPFKEKSDVPEEKHIEEGKLKKSKTKYVLYGVCLLLAVLCLSLAIENVEYRANEEVYQKQIAELEKQSEEDEYYWEFWIMNQDKVEFMDENIVFVVEGYGDYYYTYDQMMDVVGDNDFSFWAYTDVAAKSQGYKKYNPIH